MADDIVLRRELEEEHKFTLNYAHEIPPNVRIGCSGTRSKPPFSTINEWRQDQRLPKSYDVRVDLNGFIFDGKFCLILSIWLILRKITPSE